MKRLTAKLVHGVSRLAFWRKPVAPLPDEPAAEASMEVQPSDGEVEQTASAGLSELRIGRFEPALVLATLSNKKVWIPVSMAMLLGLIGAAMAWTSPQAALEKKHLQAERPAMTQEERAQTAIVKKEVSKKEVADTDASARVPADVRALATGGAAGESRPSVDDGACQVSDKASVARNLKACIDSFNRSRMGGADRSARKVAANGTGEI